MALSDFTERAKIETKMAMAGQLLFFEETKGVPFQVWPPKNCEQDPPLPQQNLVVLVEMGFV